MAKLTTEQLIEAFKELTLIELSEFVKAFEETFEVTAAAPVAAAAAPAAGGAAEEVEEKDSFDVILESAGEKKIQVIKEVRALTNLGLGEAKAVVDGAPVSMSIKMRKPPAVSLFLRLIFLRCSHNNTTKATKQTHQSQRVHNTIQLPRRFKELFPVAAAVN